MEAAQTGNPMNSDFETLLEHVLAAVMDSKAEPLTILWSLRQTVPEARVTALIRALLAADQVIATTFNGNSQNREDAKLARSMALVIAEAADDAEAAETPSAPLRFRDLTI